MHIFRFFQTETEVMFLVMSFESGWIVIGFYVVKENIKNNFSF